MTVLLLLLLGVLLGGCASTRLVSDQPNPSLRERSLAVRIGSTPSFYADTPERRNYGVFGVVAMMRSGNQLVEQYALQDPAAILSEDLAASLMETNRMRAASPERADLLLDIKTINWDFRPYRKNAEALYVVYSARVSLIDTRSGRVLASGKCRSVRDPDSDRASLDALLADNARLLHDELREAGHECAQRMKRETLSAFLERSVPPVASRQVPLGSVTAAH
ncbi:MAG: hypothetical protein AB7G13_24585 [Lautropia sp.]